MDACASVDGAERLDEEPFTNLKQHLLVTCYSSQGIEVVIMAYSNG